jgi:5,10-methylenetetrahydrofolate reductase
MLSEILKIDRFAVTAEFAPPKGTDMDHMRVCVRLAKGRIHAANVTDFQSAVVRISSLTACKVIMDEGVEPVIQITGRDRNRIAIQGELLSAGVLGIKNLLAITGDHPKMGDHPSAMPVYDLDSIGILQVATTFMNGQDLEGNSLNGRIEFFPGGAVSPTRETMVPQIMKMRKKILAGARFFQTQAVFDLDLLREFRRLTVSFGVPVLAGIVLLKSANMARFMNRTMPGVEIPENVVARLERFAGKERMNEGIRLAGELIRTIRDEKLADGVHIMAVGAEERVGQILDEAGL